MSMTDSQLFNTACDAMKKAYAPYSECYVGAALVCDDGSVYTGCNIENAAFTPGICAERTAISKAVSEGKRKFTKIMVVGGKDGVIKGTFPPCGVCRQVLREFCDDDFEVMFGVSEDNIEHHTMKEILPFSFSSKDM